MSLRNIDELNEVHVDTLKEIGNIGFGNAVTALSVLTGKEISVRVPHVKILGFEEATEIVGGPENIVAGLLIAISGDICGMILYIYQIDFARITINNFFGKEIDDFQNLDPMDKSMLNEIGNIMAGSYVNALSEMTGLKIDISSPSLSIDMAGAILSVPAIEFAMVGDKVLFIEDLFGIGGKDVSSRMILVPEMHSLNILFNKLGVNV
jgi:chemotaxis protein CheC